MHFQTFDKLKPSVIGDLIDENYTSKCWIPTQVATLGGFILLLISTYDLM